MWLALLNYAMLMKLCYEILKQLKGVHSHTHLCECQISKAQVIYHRINTVMHIISQKHES